MARPARGRSHRRRLVARGLAGLVLAGKSNAYPSFIPGLQRLPPPEEEKQLQGEEQTLKEEVGAEDASEVVAKWTGVPVSRLMESEVENLLHVEDGLR